MFSSSEPDWSEYYNKYCVIIFDRNFIVDSFSNYYQVLSFPTEEMATDFMNCFKDLLEVAKPLV